jgi:GNAT superfamily N-acetyltransferase
MMTHISELRRDESAALDELLAKMSPYSRYGRFHAFVPELTGTLRRALLDVDGHNHIALVARADHAVVGIARMIRDRDRSTEAEITVAVTDGWHRRGVGRELIEAWIGRAGALGIGRVRASHLPWNAPALGLIRALFRSRSVGYGSMASARRAAVRWSVVRCCARVDQLRRRSGKHGTAAGTGAQCRASF